jgi:hypothetical protein
MIKVTNKFESKICQCTAMNSYSTHATIIANHITAKDKEAFRQVFDSFAVGRDGTLTCEQAKVFPT